MSNIVVKMKDGSTKEFKHQGRAGGSYTKTLKIEGACAVIENEYYEKVYIPLDSVEEIRETPTRW